MNTCLLPWATTQKAGSLTLCTGSVGAEHR
jgi:hypothetical protein